MKLLLLLSMLFAFVNAGEVDLGGVNTHEKLGAMVPLDLKFLDQEGEEKTLKQLMNAKPTLLTINYYRCAGVCTTELNNFAKTLSEVDLKEGKDYQVLTLSFTEDETPAMAKHKRRTILRSIDRPFDHAAWNFVVGENGSANKLVDAVGFRYKVSDLPSETTQYTHGTGVIVLSPTGEITHYLRGIHQLPLDVKMAVLDAIKGRVTPSIPKQLQACSDFHPKEKYVAPTEEIVGTVMTIVAIILFLFLYLTNKKKRAQITKEEYYQQQEEEKAKDETK